MAKTYKFLVLSNPVEGREDEYNTWYDNTHLADVLKVDGFVAAQRFSAVPMEGADQPYRYMAIYEIEANDPHAVLAALNGRAGTPDMVLSDALGSDVLAILFGEHGPRVKA